MFSQYEQFDSYGIDYHHNSAILNRTKKARVLLPKNKKYIEHNAVCYLLHPYATNRFFWTSCLKKNISAENLPFPIVIPESGRRWFINDNAGHQYEDYLINELAPSVEAKIFNNNKNIKRIIGGFSMGGAAAVFLSMRYPGKFNVAFSISGAFAAAERIDDPYQSERNNSEIMIPDQSAHEAVWGEINSHTRKVYNLNTLLPYAKLNSWNTKIIIEVGKQDFSRIVHMNRQATKLLSEHNITHDYAEQDGIHNKIYAEKAIVRMLEKCLTII